MEVVEKRSCGFFGVELEVDEVSGSTWKAKVI